MNQASHACPTTPPSEHHHRPCELDLARRRDVSVRRAARLALTPLARPQPSRKRNSRMSRPARERHLSCVSCFGPDCSGGGSSRRTRPVFKGSAVAAPNCSDSGSRFRSVNGVVASSRRGGDDRTCTGECGGLGAPRLAISSLARPGSEFNARRDRPPRHLA